MIAVTFALPAESSDFLRLLANPIRAKHGVVEVTKGLLDGQTISVMHTGVGEKSARARLATFLDAETPSALISAGFAGALRDDLGVGDLFLAENHSSQPLFAGARAALAPDGAHTGSLATARDV